MHDLRLPRPFEAAKVADFLKLSNRRCRGSCGSASPLAGFRKLGTRVEREEGRGSDGREGMKREGNP